MAIDPRRGPDFSPAISATDEGTIVAVWAVAGASRTEIVGIHDEALRIRVSAPAHGDRANRALAGVLADVAGTNVELLHGHRGRRKTFLLRGVRPRDFVRRLAGE